MTLPNDILEELHAIGRKSERHRPTSPIADSQRNPGTNRGRAGSWPRGSALPAPAAKLAGNWARLHRLGE